MGIGGITVAMFANHLLHLPFSQNNSYPIQRQNTRNSHKNLVSLHMRFKVQNLISKSGPYVEEALQMHLLRNSSLDSETCGFKHVLFTLSNIPSFVMKR